jgi:cholesterol oxidase
MAERAMALWPNAGEADARPVPGAGYRRVTPIVPKDPVVPDHAPGALRLPIDLGMPAVPVPQPEGASA